MSACYKKINTYRKNAGVKAISRNADIEKLAKTRAKELVKKYSHTRPNGKDGQAIVSWNLCGIINNQKHRGENIAEGYSTCDSVMNGWYHSAGHRRNMLASKYRKVGIAGYRYKGVIYWVQLFAS